MEGLRLDGSVDGLPAEGLPIEGLPVEGRDIEGRVIEGREVGVEGRIDGRLIDGERFKEGEREGIDRPMLEPARLIFPPPRPRCAKQASLEMSNAMKAPHTKANKKRPERFITAPIRLEKSCVIFGLL